MFEITKEIDSQIQLLDKELCDHCLGRLFGKWGQGLTNVERGKIIRETLHIPMASSCYICNNLFNDIDVYVDQIVKKLSNIEFDTFLIGSRVSPEMQGREESVWMMIGTQYPESIKSELNREIGKLVSKAVKKRVDFNSPNILVIVDTMYGIIDIQIASLYIFGRYRKLVRGIPQTRWICTRCGGNGCIYCNKKGKLYPTSVQELIAQKVIEITNGTDHTFHGMGREDIDARMLGNGRPFILEIKNPKHRKIDYEVLKTEINTYAYPKVEVDNLRYATRRDVVKLKDAKCPKTYRVLVESTKSIEKEKLKKVCNLFRNTEIMQYTPLRVLHRRANLCRKRKILKLEACNVDKFTYEFTITAESGTYIKEFITGDETRTTPNLSGAFETVFKVKELDVIYIHSRSL